MNPHFTNRTALLGLATLCTAVLTPSLSAQTTDRDHLADNVFGQMSWKELGPVSSGGRIVDIAVHPTKPQIFWVAAASGGIWKTTNGGTSFEPQFQNQHSISIGDIAVAPSDPDVLYIGTGPIWISRRPGVSGGISPARPGKDGVESRPDPSVAGR